MLDTPTAIGQISRVVWTRALGFTYAVLLAVGAIVAAVWGIAYYRWTHQLVTTLSTAVSGFATYAVGLVALYVAAHQLAGFFRRLYDATRNWKLPFSIDARVVIFGVLGLLGAWPLWR